MRSLAVFFALFLALMLEAQFVRPQQAQRFTYKVVRALPHDPEAFTQGFEFRNGVFYEGTGLNGRSFVRRVEPTTGRVLASVPLEGKYFGEGITVLGGKIHQLTWKHGQGFTYDQKTLRRQSTFQYPGEGWGLANDGKQIYMSDGTAEIRIWNAATLQELRRMTVRYNGRPVSQLNELEWVEGELYANVWQTDSIVRIRPTDGTVTGVIDLTGLLGGNAGEVDVLNGIAYDAAAKRLYVTGKLWPKVFEIQVVPVR
ncbi:MAG: glutaminyl-peptide cyclotransferase [Bryobacter sp.]|nr:glutaminyl-peptide cyclotransferase [Bryobacter sp.]